MAFSIAQYAALRPTLWHLTHRQNLAFIEKSRLLMPADRLAATPLESLRRVRHLEPGVPVLRDQELLQEKCIQLQAGFSFTDWLKELNRRVFFWSGWPDRPIKAARDARDRYHHSDIMIRCLFLQIANDHTPYFSRCNSGAPRMQHGKKVPRGPNTFLLGQQCDFPPSKVVEITFLQPVKLPWDCEVRSSLEGPWEIL